MTALLKIKYTTALLGIAALLFSCEKKIPFDDEVNQSKLVLNESFSPGTNFVVHVSNSLSVIDAAELRGIENAEVKLYQGDVLLETMVHTENGFYQGPLFVMPETDVDYRLEVSAPDFDPVIATGSAPSSQLEILNIDTTYFTSQFNSNRSLRLEITLRDNDPGENFFGVSANGLFINSETGDSYTDNFYLNSSDVIFGGENGDSEYGSELTFDDALLNQTDYLLTLNITNIDGNEYWIEDEEGNWVIISDEAELLYLNISSYSKDLYLYNESYRRYYETEGNPFAQPTRVHTNVEGGYGIFGGFNETAFEFEL